MNLLETLLGEYVAIEESIPTTLHLNGVTYDALVNFNESMELPRHRWFPYKEGFSPSFVHSFISRYAETSKPLVLDPFAGVGTTIIEAALHGYSGVGLDVSPLSIFIAQTKALCFTDNELRMLEDAISLFANSKLPVAAEPPSNATVISYFEPRYLEVLLRVKQFYKVYTQEKIASIFKLAFLNLIEPFSTHRKAGNGLKRKAPNRQPALIDEPMFFVKEAMLSTLRLIKSDLVKHPSIAETDFIYGSSLEKSNIPNRQFNCVLTSPPYANCFDYSKIYMCELWLADFFVTKTDQQNFRMNSVRSHVHASWPDRHEQVGSCLVEELISPYLREQDLWSNKIPDMLQGYFRDLGKLLINLESVTVPGTPIGIVVGNSAYGGIPVATDLIIAEMARKQGYDIVQLEIYRGVIPSSQQYTKLDSKKYFRESLVVLRRQQ